MLRTSTLFTRRVQPSLFSRNILRLQSTAAIPKTQKGVIFYENKGKLHYKDIPVPEPKPNEILINVKYSGVCHTDLHAWHGDWPLPVKLPLVGGHEGAGVVVKLGSNVKGWKVGDLAGIKWLNGSCMTCEFCESGHESNCPDADLSGYTHDGSFQQFATADAIQAAKIQQGTDLAEVAPILCAGVTVYKALKEADLKAGDWVAISGAAGGLGSLAVQYATAMGYRVLGIDAGEEKEKLFQDATKAVSGLNRKTAVEVEDSQKKERYVGVKSIIEYEIHNEGNKKNVSEDDQSGSSYIPVTISKDSVTKAYRYGADYVVLPSVLVDQTVYESFPGLDLRGFLNREALPRYFLTSESSFITADTRLGCQSDLMAFSALVDVMLENRKIAVARYVSKKDSEVNMCALCPVLIEHSNINSEKKFVKSLTLCRLPSRKTRG